MLNNRGVGVFAVFSLAVVFVFLVLSIDFSGAQITGNAIIQEGAEYVFEDRNGDGVERASFSASLTEDFENQYDVISEGSRVLWSGPHEQEAVLEFTTGLHRLTIEYREGGSGGPVRASSRFTVEVCRPGEEVVNGRCRLRTSSGSSGGGAGCEGPGEGSSDSQTGGQEGGQAGGGEESGPSEWRAQQLIASESWNPLSGICTLPPTSFDDNIEDYVEENQVSILLNDLEIYA